LKRAIWQERANEVQVAPLTTILPALYVVLKSVVEGYIRPLSDKVIITARLAQLEGEQAPLTTEATGR
jgi:hypothetical protein